MTDPRPAPTRLLLAALVLVAALAAAWPAAPVAEAQAPILIRMATLVPDGSSWYLILKEAADKWKQVSGGRVTVRLFPGGVAGDDPDVVRKMRLGTLNAGLLTSVGVAEIDRSVYAMGIPLMYDSYDEVYWVHEKMRPRLEASLEAKGFVVLNWADGGWVNFFSTKPVAVPDDLRKLKLFTWAGDAESVEVWRSAGFNPVPLPSTEIATALQTGPGGGARLAAAGRGDLAVLQPREVHDRPALAAAPGRDHRHEGRLGEDPRRRAAGAAQGVPGSRCAAPEGDP